MKKYTLSVLTICFITITSFAQNGLITLENEYYPDGSIAINASSKANCKYTIKLNFTSLSGYSNNRGGNPYITTVNAGTSQVTKLSLDKNAGFKSLNYTYSFYPGVSFRKAPNNYTHYMLPIAAGKTTQVTAVSQLSTVLGQQSDSYSFAQGFKYELGDTIFASRAGIVYNINNQLKQGEGGNTVYTSDRNHIYIQHKDGTLAYYTILAPINCLVQNGDFVTPGQPIAVFNVASQRYTMLFSVYYLDEEKIRTDNIREMMAALPVYYYLNENAPSTNLAENQKYESVKSIEIIGEELSNREKKKIGIGN
jgi:hypothetical protein